MKRCDCEHWEICPTCFPQGFDEDGNRKPAERPPTRAELVEKVANLVAENTRLLQANRDCVDHFDALKVDFDKQAEQLAAAESRLHDVATHCATVEQQLAAAEKAMNRCYKMLLSEPDTKGALFKAENILREALADAVIAAQKGEK